MEVSRRTTNDLVNRIYSLNDVKEGFWKDYLERIRSDMKVTWYHASGFDLRPLHIIFSLAQPNSTMSKIGLELYNTDLLYSNIGCGMGYDLYGTFLNIWKKKSRGVDLNDSDLPHKDITNCDPPKNYPNDVSGFPSAEAYSSVEPFSIFTKEERMMFYNGNYGESANQSREYDGFAIKLKYYTSTYITIIYLCLDDFIVKHLIDSFNINVGCVFENSPNRPNIDNLFDVPDGINNIKYIFSDGGIPTKYYNVWQLVNQGQYYYPIACEGKMNYDNCFSLAISKNITDKFICPLHHTSHDGCLRTTRLANPSNCPYASEKVELNLAEQEWHYNTYRNDFTEIYRYCGIGIGRTDDVRGKKARWYDRLAGDFQSLGSYKDAERLTTLCREFADANRNFNL